MIVGPPPPSTPRHKKYPTKGPTAPPRESPQYSPRSGRQPLLPVSVEWPAPFAPGHMTADPHCSSEGWRGLFSVTDQPDPGASIPLQSPGGLCWGCSSRQVPGEAFQGHPVCRPPGAGLPGQRQRQRPGLGCPHVQGGPSGLRGPGCPCRPAPSATQAPVPAHLRGRPVRI